jgi:hypothetical protein
MPEHDGPEGLLLGLVGRAQADSGRSQLVFDPEGDRGVARQARNGLYDHPVEARRPPRRVGEQLLEAAVPRDGDVEAGEAAGAAGRVGASAGLDVVEVGDDPPTGLGHLSFGVLQLAGEAEGRILLVFGRDPPVPGVAGRWAGGRGHGETSSSCPTSVPPMEASRAESALPWAAASARPASPLTRRTSMRKVSRLPVGPRTGGASPSWWRRTGRARRDACGRPPVMASPLLPERVSRLPRGWWRCRSFPFPAREVLAG